MPLILSHARAEQVITIIQLQDALNELHKDSTLSELVYIVERLDGGRDEKVRARITPYKCSLEDSPVPQDFLDLAGLSETKYEVIEYILDMDKDDRGYLFRVCWPRLPDPKDYTWHKVANFYHDIPDMAIDYLKTTANRGMDTKVKQLLTISA